MFDTLLELRESERPAPREPFSYEEEALRIAAESKRRLAVIAEKVHAGLTAASDLEQDVWKGTNYGEKWDEETENRFWEVSTATAQHLDEVVECLRLNPVEDGLLPDIYANIFAERPVFCALSADSEWKSGYGTAMASVAEHLEGAYQAFTEGADAYGEAAVAAGVGSGGEERKRFWEKGRDDALAAAEGAKKSADEYRAAAASLGK